MAEHRKPRPNRTREKREVVWSGRSVLLFIVEEILEVCLEGAIPRFVIMNCAVRNQKSDRHCAPVGVALERWF